MTQAPPPLPSLEPLRGPAVPAWDFLRRNRHVTVPLAVPPAFLAAGAVLAQAPHAGLPTAVGAGVLGASVWWAAPHKWDRAAEQWYARLSALAAGGWLSATALAGLGVPELIAAAPLSLAWGIPWYAHKRPRRHAAKVLDQWAAWWLYYARNWGLHGSHVLDVTTHGVIDTLTIQLHAGHQTLADVKEILPRLESALQGHVAPGMTRCEANGRRGDQVLIHLKRANPHDAEVAWEPSLVPVTITGEMPLFMSEAAEWVMVPCMALNWLILGALGGGKSNEGSVMLASVTACPDALAWGIDLKGGKSLRPWAGALDWVATTVEEARLMLRTLLAEVRARALHGYDGNEEMTPSPQVPAIFLFVDEAHNIVSQMSGDPQCQRDLAAIASECRSSAVRVIVCTQYGALYESVGTEQTRGNLKNRICFRVAEKAHGQFALDDWVTLDASRLENPGECYYRLERDTASAPARAPNLPHPQVREIAARNAAVSRPLLRLYASEHQATYDARWDRSPAAFRPGALAAVPAPLEVPVTAPPPWQEALDRIEDEVASVPDLPAPPPVDDALLRRTVEGRMRLWARLLQDAPPAGVEPKTLNSGSGMSNSWTHLKLPRLIDLGYVTKIGKGRYAPVAGQDVWEGLERIREADDRLAELAGVG